MKSNLKTKKLLWFLGLGLEETTELTYPIIRNDNNDSMEREEKTSMQEQNGKLDCNNQRSELK